MINTQVLRHTEFEFLSAYFQKCRDQLQYGIVKVNLVSHVLALAIRCRRHRAEMQIQSQARLYGICGGQSNTETDFSLNSSVFPCQYYPTNAAA